MTMNRNETWDFNVDLKMGEKPSDFVPSDEQQLAVDAIVNGTGDVALIAAAGSGKTSTVVHAAVALLARGQAVRLMSFSTEAVYEMNSRLADLHLQPHPDGENNRKMIARTFHSVACEEMRVPYVQKIVKFDAQGNRKNVERALCVDRNYEERQRIWLDVLNTQAAEKIELREVDEDGEADDLQGLFDIKDPEHRKTVQRLTTIASRLTAEGIKISERARVESWLTTAGLDVNAAAWLEDYSRQVSKNGLWTYADTIIDWYANGPRSQGVLIVDEAQDMDPILLKAAMHVASKGRLIVVADARQTVHVWKGADPSVFLGFSNRPSTTTVYLNENRRSPQNIVDLGNQIMEPYEYGKPAATSRKGGEPAIAGEFRAGPPSAIVLMARLAAGMKAGQQVAVLTRTWAALRRFEAACFKAGILYTCKQRWLNEYKLRKFKEIKGKTWLQSVDHFLSKNPSYYDLATVARGFDTEEAYAKWCRHYLGAAQAGEDDRVQPTVYLGTAHSSKGLTLHTVILVTTAKWNKPEQHEREDADRLLYVAVTRASDRLYVFPDENGAYPDSV